MLGTNYLFCGYLVFFLEFFFAIDLISTEVSMHVVEYQEEGEAKMAMVWAVFEFKEL